MRSLYSSFLVFALFLQTSCTNIGVGEQNNNDDKPLIGFIMADFLSERWVLDSQYVSEKLRALGTEVEIRVGDNNDSLQLEHAKELIDQGAKVLLVIPSSAEGGCEIVEYAHENNVKVIAYERLIINCDVDYYISFDGVEVGRLQAKYMVERIPKGNYMLINGPLFDHNSKLFYQGQMEVLKPFVDRGDINIIYDKNMSDWIPAEAFAETYNFLDENGANVDAIIVANDLLAEGVIDAYRGLGYNNIPTTGQDGQICAIRRIAKGSQSMTVYKSLHLLSEEAAQLAYDLAKGKDFNVEHPDTINNGGNNIPCVKIAPEVIDIDNFQEIFVGDSSCKKK